MGRNILITGGAGFIGANFVHYITENNPEDKLYVIDSLSYSGNISNIQKLINSRTIKFSRTNILDKKEISKILNYNDITNIIHFAAESHVDRSIMGPEEFVKTNIHGTFTLLDSFKSYWEENNRAEYLKFIHISTDEVFGSLRENDPPFNENSNYLPSSPYSASKAASDHLVMAWNKTYGLPTCISNCSNNYGPYQFPEKLIPLTITRILNGKSIPIYGNGSNIRDWLYVEDHCIAITKIMNSGKAGSQYCIGGNNEINNIKLVKIICSIVDEIATEMQIKIPTKPSFKLVEYVDDRLGHDRRYAINNSFITKELSWEPKVNLKTGLNKTIKWYLNNRQWWEKNI